MVIQEFLFKAIRVLGLGLVVLMLCGNVVKAATWGTDFFAVAMESDRSPDQQASVCTLIVSKISPQESKQWQSLGYQIQVMEDISKLPAVEIAALLKDAKTYALVRGSSGSKIWLNVHGPQAGTTWRPIGMAAPKEGQSVTSQYGCANMQKRHAFYKDSRQSITDMLKILNRDRIDRTHGEVILDLERSFFVHNNQGRFLNTNTKDRYLKILKKVKDVKSKTLPDFFISWVEVRKIVFGDTDENIDYCSAKASMSEALLESCTNCVGESYLLTSLFYDGNFRLPEGWELGAQLFKDHIRPVAYNKEQKKTYDLATGRFENFKASITDIRQLYIGLWTGHHTLRFEVENEWVKNIKPEYVYKSCYMPGMEMRPQGRPSVFSHIHACDNFSDSLVPEYADNKDKTTENKFVEDDATNGGDGSSGSTSLWEMAKGAVGAVAALPGMAIAFPGMIIDGIFGSEKNDFDNVNFIKLLNLLSENVIPSEQAILKESISKKILTKEAFRVFSSKTLFQLQGHGHHSLTLKQDSLFLPFRFVHIDDVTKEEEEGYNSDFSFDKVKSSWLESGYFIAGVSDPYSHVVVFYADRKFMDEFKDLSSIERQSRIISKFYDDFKKEADIALRLFRDTDPKQSIDEIFVQQKINFSRLKNVMRNLEVLKHAFTLYQMANSKSYNQNRSILLEIFKNKLQQAGGIEFINAYKDFDQVLNEHTVSIVQALELLVDSSMNSQSKMLLDVVKRNIQDYGQIGYEFQRLRDDDSESYIPFSFQLLMNVLTHEEYFFTVEPEDEEEVLYRPYYPLKVLDPQVKDRKQTQRHSGLPQINLPQVPAPAGICEGATDLYVYYNGFYFECPQSGGSVADAQAQQGQHEKSQQGREGGVDSPHALTDSDRMGQDEVSKSREGLADPTYGEDEEGDLVLRTPMTPEQQRLQAQKDAQDLPTLSSANSVMGPYSDPRQEVHLQTDTWRVLLELSQHDYPESEMIDIELLKVLVHHAYRNKMQDAFSSPFISLGTYKIIGTTSLLQNQILIDIKKYKHFKETKKYEQIFQSGTSSKDTDLTRWLQENIDEYKGQYHPVYDKDFVKQAFKELKHPKTGYLVAGGFSKTPPADADILKFYMGLHEFVLMEYDQHQLARGSIEFSGVFVPSLFMDSAGTPVALGYLRHSAFGFQDQTTALGYITPRLDRDVLKKYNNFEIVRDLRMRSLGHIVLTTPTDVVGVILKQRFSFGKNAFEILYNPDELSIEEITRLLIKQESIW